MQYADRVNRNGTSISLLAMNARATRDLVLLEAPSTLGLRASGVRWSWTDVALVGAFVMMISVCVAGWFTFAPRETVFMEWLAPVVRELASRPWLFVGAACVGLLEVLTLVRRQRATME
jgi:hypothetical protein